MLKNFNYDAVAVALVVINQLIIELMIERHVGADI